MIEAVIFDAWGTLFKNMSNPSPFREINALLGKSFDDYDYLLAFEHCTALDTTGSVTEIGAALLKRIRISLGDDDRSRLEFLLRSAFIGEIQVYDDAIPALDILRGGYRIGLLSNCGVLAADNLRTRFHVDDIFDAVVFSYELQRLKPDAAVFEHIARRLGVSRLEYALFVGDHPVSDYQGALEAGLAAILLDRKGRHMSSHVSRISSLFNLYPAIEAGDFSVSDQQRGQL